jgi:hypothetical protein
LSETPADSLPKTFKIWLSRAFDAANDDANLSQAT